MLSRFVCKDYTGIAFKVFLSTFGLYIIICILSHSFVKSPYTDYFISYDQILFFTEAESIYNNQFTWDNVWEMREYSGSPMAFYVFALLFGFAKLLHISDILLFMKLNNAFVGSLIFFFLFDLCQRLGYVHKHLKKDVFLFAVLSPIMLLSCQLLRDVHISFLYTLIVWLVAGFQYRIKWVLIIILIMITYSFRIENGMFALIFLLIKPLNILFESKSKKMYKVAILVFLIVAFYVLNISVAQTMVDTIEHYTARSLEAASEDSMGARLASFPFPFDIISKTTFAMLLPFPLWFNFAHFDREAYLMIGETFFPYYWCTMLVVIAFALYRNFSQWDKKLLVLLLIGALYLFVCSASEFGTRRLTAIYPLFFVSYEYVKTRFNIKISYYLGSVTIAIMFLNLVYFLIR